MRIFNPSFGMASAGGPAAALKPVNWATDPIALMSNSKPNARELLEGMRARLGAVRSVDNIHFHAKNSASQPAPKDLIAKIAQNYKAALLALGD